MIVWDNCRPKSKRGLENKKTEDVNAPFLAKQGWKVLTWSDNRWVQLIKAKYLKKYMNFLQSKKTNIVSIDWKYILDHWYFIKRAIIWVFSDSKSINF